MRFARTNDTYRSAHQYGRPDSWNLHTQLTLLVLSHVREASNEPLGVMLLKTPLFSLLVDLGQIVMLDARAYGPGLWPSTVAPGTRRQGRDMKGV